MIPIKDRLLAKTKKTESCWLWFGSKTTGGYGLIRTSGDKNKLTHRVSWEEFCGQIPEGLKVLHRCDIPACVNPEHLFLGTQADNMADMSAKGRHRSRSKPESVRRGERHYAAKLNPEIVAAIRASKGIETQRSIAARLGLSEAAISLIMNGKRWA